MTIKEIEERTGMDRANIRFYEKEGMLSPQRLANGYRDYTEQDVDTLLRIKLLRSLHVPLEEIRAMQKREKTLSAAIQTHLHVLENEAAAVSAAQAVCRAIQNDRADYMTLNANKYLQQLQSGPQAQQSQRLTVPAEDTAPHPAHPWLRLFARTLDYDLYLLPLELLCLLVFRLNPNTTEGKVASVVCIFIAYLTMVFVEPMLLHFFGTTPGKWIFGLHITNDDGTYLSYKEGRRRTWNVIRYGYGFGIPFYSLYRQWKSYKVCLSEEPCIWDDFPASRSYVIRDTKLWRVLVWFIVVTACVFLNEWAQGFSALPPNRGELTIAEFAENYNYLADYYYDTAWYFELMPDGTWAHHPEISEYTFYYGGGERPPKLEYFTDEAGYLTGFQIREENCTAEELTHADHLKMTALAFTAAQPEARPFSNTAPRILNRFPQLGDFEMTVYKVKITRDLYYPDDKLSYTFTVTKNAQP